MHIGGKEVRTGKTQRISPPHDHQHTLVIPRRHATTSAGHRAALAARPAWADALGAPRRYFPQSRRLLAGPFRARINAATMLGQSKNAFQAEIDAACELIDFFRFNVHFMQQIYSSSPRACPACGTAWSTGRWKASYCTYTLQLHVHRRQPAFLGGHDGQHGGLETCRYPGLLGPCADGAVRGAGVPAGVINLIMWMAPWRAMWCSSTRFRGHPLHRFHGGIPEHLADNWPEHAPVQVLSAHRGRNGRQGLILAHRTAHAKA